MASKFDNKTSGRLKKFLTIRLAMVLKFVDKISVGTSMFGLSNSHWHTYLVLKLAMALKFDNKISGGASKFCMSELQRYQNLTIKYLKGQKNF